MICDLRLENNLPGHRPVPATAGRAASQKLKTKLFEGRRTDLENHNSQIANRKIFK